LTAEDHAAYAFGMGVGAALFGISMLLAVAAPARAWLVLGPDDSVAHVLGADPDGDLVVAGAGSAAFSILKLDREARQAQWVRELPAIPVSSPSSFLPPRLAVAPDGDAVVLVSDAAGLHVHRLDGATGASVWQITLADVSSHGVPGGVAMDAAADVVVGALASIDSLGDQALLIVKLAGGDGAEIWRYVLPEVGVNSIATLPSGDVFAAGFSPGNLEVVKLAGADGTELWRYTTPAPPSGFGGDGAALAAGPSGDAFVALAAGQLSILRLDGTTGTETWRYDTPQTFHAFPTIAIDPDGDVVASGTARVIKVAATDGSLVWSTDTGYGWPVVNAQGDVLHVSTAPNAVTKLDGASGMPIAAERITPTSGDWFALSYQTSLALLAHEVVAVGQVNWNSQNRAFAVFGFGDRLAGAKLLLKDPGDPSVRTFRLTSKDRGLALPDPDDPAAPTAAGATLEITNPATNESTSLALPSAGWTVTPPKAIGGTRYKYLDKTAANGPCKVVVLKGNRALKAKCDGAGIAFTLDEATQGGLDVRLVLPGGFARCLSFGGTLLRDEPGQFVATKAGPPPACAGGL
jgi:outer membrane protein assembly factor BamB